MLAAIMFSEGLTGFIAALRVQQRDVEVLQNVGMQLRHGILKDVRWTSVEFSWFQEP